MQTMTTISRPVQFSKIDYCPTCNRKLCCRKEIQGTPLVEFKHKGSRVLGTELIVNCLGCGQQFIVAADKGIIDEVTIGTAG